jgi:hypothetical protein
MVAVKVPTANGGHNKYNTKAGMFKAITPILLEWFQPALVAQCHQGTFFKDVDIWQTDAWHNKFWMAHMCIPQIWILPTRLLFEESSATYAALSPTTNAT